MIAYGGCIYLDLLGFKVSCDEDEEVAERLLDAHDAAIREKILDGRQVEPYVEALCWRQGVDSFGVYLPVSDSVVILFRAEDLSRCVLQVANFVFDAYFSTGHVYAHPLKQEPVKQPIPECRVTAKGCEVLPTVVETWPPVLFRGAIAMGPARIKALTAILPSAEGQEPSVAHVAYGRGVNEAVKLGDKFVSQHEVKGPRVLLATETYRLLDAESQRLVAACTDLCLYRGQPVYELLWPACTLDPSGAPRSSVETYILGLLQQAARLRDYYRGPLADGTCQPEVEPHYRSFIRLLVRSTLCFYNGDKGARDALTRQLAEQRLLSEPWLQDLL